MTVRGTIARNTGYNALGRAWEVCSGLFLTWYIVRWTGLEGLGLWSLALAFTGYAALFDAGLSSGFARHIAARHAVGDRRGLSAVVAIGVAFYTVCGLAVVAVAAPLVGPAVAWFSEDAARHAELRSLFLGALWIFAAQQVIAPFSAVPVGLQRMGVANAMGFATGLVKLAATVGFLRGGHGVLGLLYAHAVVALAQALIAVPVAFWLAPGLRPGPGALDRAVFRELFGFGWRSQVARLANLINFQTDRVVLAMVSRDVALVGAYRLGEDLASKLRQGPAMLVTALTPAAADLDARDQTETLRRMCVVSTKYMAVAAVPLSLYSMAAAGPLLRAWMGDLAGIGTAAWVLRLLALGYLANLLAGPAMSVALGMGRAELAMRAGLVSAGVNIALTVALVVPFGVYGVAAATSLGMIVSTLWFAGVVSRIFDVRPRAFARDTILWPVAASLPGVVLCAGIARAAEGADQLGQLGAAALGAAVFGLCYAVTLRVSPFLDDFDRRFLSETLGLGRLPGFRWLVGGPRHA